MARRKRNRFLDRKDAAQLGLPPKISKFIPGEAAKDRHARRLGLNLSYEDEWREWREQRGVWMTVTNQGHHWKFMHKNGTAEWWPSSAKLVLGKRYRDGIHAHDASQVRPLLANFLSVEE